MAKMANLGVNLGLTHIGEILTEHILFKICMKNIIFWGYVYVSQFDILNDPISNERPHWILK